MKYCKTLGDPLVLNEFRLNKTGEVIMTKYIRLGMRDDFIQIQDHLERLQFYAFGDNYVYTPINDSVSKKFLIILLFARQPLCRFISLRHTLANKMTYDIDKEVEGISINPLKNNKSHNHPFSSTYDQRFNTKNLLDPKRGSKVNYQFQIQSNELNGIQYGKGFMYIVIMSNNIGNYNELSDFDYLIKYKNSDIE